MEAKSRTEAQSSRTGSSESMPFLGNKGFYELYRTDTARKTGVFAEFGLTKVALYCIQR